MALISVQPMNSLWSSFVRRPLQVAVLLFSGLWACTTPTSQAPLAQEPTPAEPLTAVFVEVSAVQRRPDILWLDARAASDYASGHIAGAVSAPWQAFTSAPNTGVLVAAAELQQRIQAIGVDASDTIVVYGAWDAAWGEEGRLFWMLEYAGHANVHILRGGIAEWIAAGGAVDRVVPAPTTGTFVVQPREEFRATREEVAAAGSEVAVLDTRTEEEYQGAMWYNEARGGHVPGAHHTAWQSFLQGATSPEAARAVLLEAGISPDAPVIAYCTGGIRSGFVYAVLRAAGVSQVANYDGSWWEWSADATLPVELRAP
jgi:thiosulfate/3-mercaptopyruvate sulfurtransferase